MYDTAVPPKRFDKCQLTDEVLRGQILTALGVIVHGITDSCRRAPERSCDRVRHAVGKREKGKEQARRSKSAGIGFYCIIDFTQGFSLGLEDNRMQKLLYTSVSPLNTVPIELSPPCRKWVRRHANVANQKRAEPSWPKDNVSNTLL